MHHFWLNGYASTTVDELCSAMDIRPGSLYKTFGSKRELFIKSLEYYEQYRQVSDHPFERIDSGIGAIHMIFESVTKHAVLDTERKGCFLVNSIAELAAEDEAVASIGAESFGHLEDMFNDLLLKAQKANELSADKDPRALAKYLVNLLFGLRLTAKVNQNPTDLRSIVESGLLVLR